MCGYDPFWMFEMQQEYQYLEELEEFKKEQKDECEVDDEN